MNDIHQLIKLEGTLYGNVFPKAYVQGITDKNSGKTLDEILSNFNMYFLSYDGDIKNTRLQVPLNIRKKGLWVTYINLKGNVVTEWYNNNSVEDKDWENSDNWIDGSNMLSGDLAISSEGYWVINGVNTKLPARGKEGITPLLRGFNGKLQVSYNNGESFNYLDLPTFVKEDNEDIKAIIDSNGIKELKFADKAYNPAEFSGLGKVILRKNIVQGKNVLTQEMINKPNTVYEIRYDFDLNDATINIPENCTLDFQGGSLNNGNLNNIGKVNNLYRGNAFIKSFSSKITKIKCSTYGVNNQSEPLFNYSVIQNALNNNISVYIDNGKIDSIKEINEINSITLNNTLSIKSIVKIYGEGTLYFPNSDGFIFNNKSDSRGNVFKNVAIRSKNHCFNLANDGKENRPYNIYISTFKNLSLISDTTSCVYGAGVLGAGDDVLMFDCLFENIWFKTPTYAFEDITGNLKNKIDRIEGIVSKAYFKDFSPQIICNCNTTYVECEWFMYFTSKFRGINTTIQDTNIETYTKGIVGSDLDTWDDYTSDNYASIFIKNVTFIYKDFINKYNLNIFTYPYLIITFDGIFNTYKVDENEVLIKCKELAGLISYNNSNKRNIYINCLTYSPTVKYLLRHNNSNRLNSYDDIYRNYSNSLLEYSSCLSLLDNEVTKLTDEDYISDLDCFIIKSAYVEINTTKPIRNLYTNFRIENNVKINIKHPLLFTILNTGNTNLIFYKSQTGLLYNLTLKPNTSALFCFIPKNGNINSIICLNVYDENNKIDSTINRPNNPNNGYNYYDTTINKNIIWNGTQWVDTNGNIADAPKKGTTAQRPTGVQIGFTYKDTDLNKWIIWNGEAWENIDGTALG